MLCAVLISATAVAQPQPPDTLWTRVYSLGSTYSYGTHLSETSDGGYIMTGVANTFVSYSDAFLLKTDSLGNEQWRRYYQSPYDNLAHSVIQTDDSDYIVCGSCEDLNHNYDLWVFKTDSLGNTVWSTEFGDEYYDSASHIISTNDSGYVIIGVKENPDLVSDLWLIKIDENGEVVWDVNYSGELGSTDLFGNYVIETSDGGFVIAGTLGNAVLIRTDEIGTEIWRHYYEGNHDWSIGCFVDHTSEGGYVLSGASLDVGWITEDYYAMVIGINSFGMEKWRYVSYSSSVALCVRQISDGYVFINEGSSISLCGLNSQGNFAWNLGTASILHYFDLASEGGYIACGSSLDSQAALVKFSGDNLSVNNNRQVKLSDFILPPPQPNPFNAETLISFDLPVSAPVVLAVYDIAGREVAELENRELSAGNHVVPFNGGNLVSGVYFVRLEAGDFIQTRKCMLIK